MDVTGESQTEMDQIVAERVRLRETAVAGPVMSRTLPTFLCGTKYHYHGSTHIMPRPVSEKSSAGFTSRRAQHSPGLRTGQNWLDSGLCDVMPDGLIISRVCTAQPSLTVHLPTNVFLNLKCLSLR